MACLVPEDVVAYVRGRVTIAEVRVIASHVDHCHTCHQRVVESVRAARAPSAPVTNVQEWLSRRRARRSR